MQLQPAPTSLPSSQPPGLTTNSILPIPSEWALLSAGGRVMLTLVHSEGRAPARLLSIAPEIRWERCDGRVEALDISAASPAHVAVIRRELLGAGLLVGEYGDGGEEDMLPREVWILEKAGGHSVG